MSRLRQTKQQEKGSQLPEREEENKIKNSGSRKAPHNSKHK